MQCSPPRPVDHIVVPPPIRLRHDQAGMSVQDFDTIEREYVTTHVIHTGMKLGAAAAWDATYSSKDGIICMTFEV